MHTIIAAAIAIAFAAQAAFAAPPAPHDPPAPAAVRGRVLTHEGAPAASVCVVITDAATGLPFAGPGWTPFGDAVAAGGPEEALSKVVYATTDADGAFVFEGVPAGTYRLVAQRWPGDTEPAAPLAHHTARVELYGTAGDVKVAGADVGGIDLSPPGDGVLTVRCETGNSDTLLVISTEPTRAEPILALAGWGGPFMEHAIGWNIMPLGETTFVGVPAGTVHAAIFGPDNITGFGDASVPMRPGQRAVVEVPWVAPWSDAMHGTPPRLVPVVDRLKAAGVTGFEALTELFTGAGIPMPMPTSLGEALTAASVLIGKPVPLGDGGEPVDGADVAAAFGYMNLWRSVAEGGDEPNPWHETKIEYVPLDKADGDHPAKHGG